MSSTYERIVLNRTTNTKSSAKGPIIRTKDRNTSILDGTISCHAWNPGVKSNFVALAFTDTPTVLICSVDVDVGDCEVKGGCFKKTIKIIDHLEGKHDKPILSIDWSANGEGKTCDKYGGKIVTCSEDCRAFVWTYDELNIEWTASQVYFQHQLIPFAPMDCHWNNAGDKFVVGMGGKKTACLQICSYHPDSREWIGWNVGGRETKSSVLCVAWKPKNDLTDEDIVACGGCDYRCRVFHVSENCSNTRSGEVPVIAEYSTDDRTWVTSIAWSNQGTLAFSSKSSAIYIAENPQSTGVPPIVLKLQPNLHLSAMIFKDKTLLGVGHDGALLGVENLNGHWTAHNKPPIKCHGDVSCIKDMRNQGVSISGSKGFFQIVQL